MTERSQSSGNCAKRSRFYDIARTERAPSRISDRTVDRAKRYMEAGADHLSGSIESAEEFTRFCSEIALPLLANVTEFGKKPAAFICGVAGFGYRLVIFPQSAFRVSMKASEEFSVLSRKAGPKRNGPRDDRRARSFINCSTTIQRREMAG